MLKSLRNDAKLLGAQVKDATTTSTWLIVAAIMLGALAVTFGLVVLSMAGRV